MKVTGFNFIYLPRPIRPAVGSGAHSAPAWPGWLPANAIAGSTLLVACSRPHPAASHSVLTSRIHHSIFRIIMKPVALPIIPPAISICYLSVIGCCNIGMRKRTICGFRIRTIELVVDIISIQTEWINSVSRIIGAITIQVYSRQISH